MTKDMAKNIMAETVVLSEQSLYVPAPVNEAAMIVSKEGRIIVEANKILIANVKEEVITPDINITAVTINPILNSFIELLKNTTIIDRQQTFVLFCTHFPEQEIFKFVIASGIREIHYIHDLVDKPMTARHFYEKQLNLKIVQHFLSDLPVEYKRAMKRMD